LKIRATFLFFFITCALFSQEELPIKPIDSAVKIDSISYKIDPLSPSKAAFYSAILPGLGQAYNKKYWKIPIVWGAIGTGIGIYIWNDGKYNELRDVYKQRIEGIPNERYDNLSVDVLQKAQRNYQRQRDLTLLITVGLYILNIIDANVDAHLKQFNVNDNLTIAPQVYQNPLDANVNMGMKLSFRFNYLFKIVT
jgi:hypothetical protein